MAHKIKFKILDMWKSNRIPGNLKVLFRALSLLCWLTAADTAPVLADSGTKSAASVHVIADPSFANTIKTTTDYINEELKNTFGDDPEKYPAVSVAMVYDKDIVWTAAFGYADLEKKIPATSETVYLLASVSKTFAAVLALQLYEQGLLSLDAPLTNYLPEFSIRQHYQNIGIYLTPRRLLNHHSGIPQEVESTGFFPFRHWDGYNSSLLNYLRRDYLSQYPGEVGVYNNVGFDISAIMVARITGQNYADLAAERLFQPLDMNSTAFGRVYDNMATGYDSTFGIIQPYSPGYGSDGANSSAVDIAQFLLMFLGEGRHPNGARILNANTVTQIMATPEISALDLYQPTLKFGLGWDNVQEPSLQYAGDAFLKGGNDVGYNCEIGIMLKWKLGVVVLCNHGAISSLPDNALIKCMQSAVEELGGPSPSPPVFPEVETESDGELIAGYYSHSTSVDRITVRDSQSLNWEKNILDDQPTSVVLSLVDGAYVDNSSPTPIKYYFKNIKMNDGSHFVMIMEMSPYMLITREKFTPAAAIPEAWRKRVGKEYLPISFLYDSISFLINSNNILSTKVDDAEILSFSKMPILPQSSSLAFFTAPVINRGDSCVRIVKNGKSEILLFNGDSYIATDTIPEIIPEQTVSFFLETNQLQWYKTVIPEAGKYFINFPRNARVVILDRDLNLTGADSTNPWVWDFPQADTFYLGMVAPRPINAFLELKTPYPVIAKAVAGAGGSVLIGDEEIYAGQSVSITATADEGYVFLSWKLEAGDGYIGDRFSSQTTLTPQSHVTISASFAEESKAVTLELENDGIGRCDPVSTISINKSQPFKIKASPDDGFAFVEWQVQNGTALLDNKYAASTTVTADTDSILKAVFYGNPVSYRDRAKIQMNAFGQNQLLAALKSHQMPLSASVFADFSPEKVEGVSFGGYYFDLSGSEKKSGLTVNQRKEIWGFSGNNASLANDNINDENGLDIVLHTGDGVSCFNPHRNINIQHRFYFDSEKYTQTPAAISGDAMQLFSIGQMTLQTVDGKAGKDSLLISRSTVDIGGAFPEDQPIMITVGQETFRLPSVNGDTEHWEKSGAVYSYTNSNFAGGTATLKFDTEQKIWKFKLARAALGGMDFSDSPIVRLAVGNYEAAMALECEQKLTGR